MLLARHYPPRGLAGKECCLQIEGDSFIKFALAHVFSQVADATTSVVDQDIETSEALHGVIHRARDLVEMCDVHLQRECTATEFFNFTSKPNSGFHIAEAERHVGAGIRQCQRNGVPEATSRARDQCHLAIEVKVGKAV